MKAFIYTLFFIIFALAGTVRAGDCPSPQYFYQHSCYSECPQGTLADEGLRVCIDNFLGDIKIVDLVDLINAAVANANATNVIEPTNEVTATGAINNTDATNATDFTNSTIGGN
eukprot:CAMPEP_0176446058 /NCGR_PEP_ID=MMETSP0127-20121128/24090_1 /TAXON_ID=938130 /ORGANISM="Platyophrya macrostoma, Strain WH" /LENGTH=113 /DNA_ID=CAMNT_0017832001 /DNA_START=12 /DNA_END=353 /DNA_ORIENTATION=-